MTNGEAIESFKYSNEQAKVRLEVEKMRMDMDEVKELEFYIERDEMAIKALEQEPCGDAIDRAEAIKVASGYCHPANVAKELANLPPVNPTKTGHWEQYGNSWEDKFKCSECGKEQPKILCGERIIGHWSDYCPNCGCRMVEPQERRDK